MIKRILTACSAVILGIMFIGVQPTQAVAGTIYVDASASPATEDGSSWANAFRSLQDALDVASAGAEIWVAAGVYYPDVEFVGGEHSADDATETFTLATDVAVYGGFDGTENAIGDRDPATNITILSGDITQDDLNGDSNNIAEDVSDIQGTNSESVVTASFTTSTAILDGVTVTAGDAPVDGGGLFVSNGSPTINTVLFIGNRSDDGGAVYNSESSPTFTNVTFENNFASTDGGAMHNTTNSSPRIEDSLFVGNSANDDGGAIHNITSSSPVIINTTFQENVTIGTVDTSNPNAGGAIANFTASAPEIINVTFIGNTADDQAGAFFSDGENSAGTVVNSVFTGNTAGVIGGAVMTIAQASPNFINSTFAYNQTLDGTNGRGGAIFFSVDSVSEVGNSIFWGNTAPVAGDDIFVNNAAPVIRDTILPSGCPGGATCSDLLSGDPLFYQTPDAGDSDWATTGDNDYGNVGIDICSPAINAGINAYVPTDSEDIDDDNDTSEKIPLDRALNQRIRFSTVDMGAYENVTGGCLSNRGFETNPLSAWNTSSNARRYEDNRTFEGDALLLLNRPRNIDYGLQTFNVNGASGDTVSFSFYVAGVQVPNKGFIGSRVRLLNNGSAVTNINCLYTGARNTFSWTLVECQVTATGAYDQIEMIVGARDTDGLVGFDAVDFSVLPAP